MMYGYQTQVQDTALLQSSAWNNQAALQSAIQQSPAFVSYAIHYHARMMIAGDIGLTERDPITYWLGSEMA